MRNETIYTRGITLILTTIKIVIKRADILSAKTLDDKDNYILLGEVGRISSNSVMYRRIYRLQFSLVIKIVWYGKFVYIDGSENCKWSVEYQCCIGGALGILIGIG